MKKLYITIDTEMDASKHWVKSYPPEYSSILEGIPQRLRPIWDEVDAHPIYFVSPEVLYEEKCCEILKNEIVKGAIIGAHLHPEYIEPDSMWGEGIEKIEPQFPCSAYDTTTESVKIQNLTKLIQDKLGVTPIWYRAARFGADEDTLHTLAKLGYQYDTSYTPGTDWSDRGGPDHSKVPHAPYEQEWRESTKEGKTEILRITEVPITIDGKRFGIIGKLLGSNWLFYKWLRPSHMTYLELKAMIEKADKNNVDILVMMFHSMEVMINKTPYVRTKWMQKYYLWRLRKLLLYALNKGYIL